MSAADAAAAPPAASAFSATSPTCPPPSEDEQAVLDRIHAENGVRLACQLRPTRDIALAAAAAAACDARRRAARTGPQRRGALCGGDVRGHARFDPARREAAALRHGVPDQPVPQRGQQRGDRGRRPAEPGARRRAARRVRPEVGPGRGLPRRGRRLRRRSRPMSTKLNHALAQGPVEPVRFGVGINAGIVIAGEIGYERHAQFTVIGDAVNVASRLQDLTRTARLRGADLRGGLSPGRARSRRPARPRGRCARSRREGESARREAGGGAGSVARRGGVLRGAKQSNVKWKIML